MPKDSAYKRAIPLGRWCPVAFYLGIVGLWCLAGTAGGAGARLMLAVIAIPALALYLWRTGKV